MQAPFQARNNYDAAQTNTARPVTQKRVLADNRPEEVAQRNLAKMMNNSPRVLQLRALSDAIHNSPQMVAERHEMNALFGGAVEPQEDGAMPAEASPAQREEKTNNIGLPNQLKSGIESLSGMSMDEVKVHYNSDKPAQLNALAYAQGNDIHLGPGQEQHLPHETWHVVQQRQRRVQATMEMSGVGVNDDVRLEREADLMGAQALTAGTAQRATQLAAYDPHSLKELDTPTAQAPAQLTVRTNTPATWAKSKSGALKVREKLQAFAQEAHNADLIYEKDELDSFFEAELKGKKHDQLNDEHALYLSFRRHVAMIRDSGGAHGHSQHAGTGDQFIVDRVNTPGQPNRASYLEMDEYLKWDSVLKTADTELYEEYLKAADGTIQEFSGMFPDGPMADAAYGNSFLYGRENCRVEADAVEVNFGGNGWQLSLTTYISAPALQDGNDNKLSLKVAASVRGNQQLSARDVRKPAGTNATLHDVVSVQKLPEAYTGNLSPVFTVDKQIEKEADPTGGAGDLKWVTKF